MSFNGTADQNILKAGGETFYGLTINKTSGILNLTSNVSVSNILNLIQGKIALAANNLIILPVTGSISGGSSTSYIIADGVGILKQNAGAGSIIFPIGTSASFLPLTLNNSGAPDNYSVNLFSDVTDNGLSGGVQVSDYNDYVKFTWRVVEELVGGSNLSVTVQWNASDEGGTFNRTDCSLGYHNGIFWSPEAPAGAVGPGPYTKARAGIAGSGSFAVGTKCTMVGDHQDPSITCVGDQSKNSDAGQCYYTVAGTEFNPAATDNCTVSSVTNDFNGGSTLAGAQFPVGVTTVVWTVTDNHSRTNTCSYTVTVIDNENPTITCATPAASYTADANQCYYTVPGTALNPSASGDNCGVQSVLNDFTGTNSLLGAQFPVGTTTVIWTVTDVHSNTTTCQYDVVVTDDQAPTITCATPAASYTADANQCYYTVPGTALNPSASGDNCGVQSVLNDFTGTNSLLGAQFPVGTTTVIWTVTDVHSNTTTCQYDVVVTDDQAPTITCATPAASYTADANQCYYTVPGTALNPSASGDNCGVQSVLNDFTGTNSLLGAQFPVGTTTVIWTVTDVHSNTTTCQYDVVVTDDQAPTITCATPAASYTADANQCYYTVPGTALDPSASGDNCGVQSVLNDFTGTNSLLGAQFPVGTTTVIWTVTDVHSNTTTCQYDVVVTDDQAPTITCATPAASYTADANQCYYTVPGTALDPSASGDNCGVQSVLNDFTGTNSLLGAQFPVGTTTVIWTVTDVHSNTTTCQYDVVVTDDQAPTITCATPAASYTADANQCYYTVPGTALDPSASGDNCGVQSVLNDFTGTNSLLGAQFPVGTTTVIWTVTDVHSNTTTCQYDVVVTDDQAPTITCATPAASYTADANQCYYTVPGTALDPSASGDNCGVQSVLNDFTGTNSLLGAQFPVGTTTVIWTVTDVHSNTTTCQYDVVVTDDQAPTITCATPAASYTADANQCYYTVPGTALDPSASGDNCGVQSVLNDFTGTNSLLGAQFPVGTTTVIWTVTDVHSNTTTCQYDVVVTDDQAPMAICKNISITLDLATGIKTITPADINNGSYDNCGIASISASKTDFNCSNIGSNNIILTVTDIHGNSSTCNSIVTVNFAVTPNPVVTPAADTICNTETTNLILTNNIPGTTWTWTITTPPQIAGGSDDLPVHKPLFNKLLLTLMIMLIKLFMLLFQGYIILVN